MTRYYGFEYFKNNMDDDFCYYRSQMNVIEKRVYDKIRNGLLAYSDSITVKGISVDGIKSIYQKIKQDNPCLFFVESLVIESTLSSITSMIKPTYRFPKKETDATLIALINKCNQILSSHRNKSQLEKEIVIHDYFCNSITYDYSFATSSFECVGPLLFGKGVCEGIAKASKMLFDFIKIKSLIIYGQTEVEQLVNGRFSNLHAWNMVKVENNFYHLDITFDLTIKSFGINRYDYFNLSDEEICRDHTISSKGIPICPLSWDYYKINKMFMESPKDCHKYLLDNFKRNNKDILFKLPVVSDANVAKTKIADIIQNIIDNNHLSFNQYQLISNDTQFVFQLRLS